MKPLFHFLLIGAALFLAGCIVPPMSLTLTPGVSGRIVDSSTGLPIAHATLAFIQNDGKTPLDAPTLNTDVSGRFQFARTSTIITGIVWNPMGGGAIVLGLKRPRSTVIRIESAGYENMLVDLQSAYRKARNSPSEPDDVRDYKAVFSLGDIPLVKSSTP